MIKKTNLLEKAKDLTIIAIVCDGKNFKESVAAFEFADEKHKRYTLFKHVLQHEYVRGQRWDGYIVLKCSGNNERDSYNAIQEFESRGVKELKVVRTANGPIIVLPLKEVIS